MTTTMPHQRLISRVLLLAPLVVLPLAVMLVAAFLSSAAAQGQASRNCVVQRVLHSFGKGSDGMRPYSGLKMDAAGNLYGTTERGGAYGNGTVFKVDTAGKETILYSFTGGSDGRWPYGILLQDKAGNLYGSTYYGGTYGNGTVFKLAPSGKETVLYSFTGTGGDGANPAAGLRWDAAGNLYGTTSNGGAYGNGTVFMLDRTHTETVLYSFTGEADGALPHTSLTLDEAGNLYGTTVAGGIPACNTGAGFGCGAVFKLDPSGNLTVLHTFTGGADGGYPVWGPLIRDAEGNLYGTTVQGGSSGNGAVFKLDSSANFTVLYSFTRGADGAEPYGGLVRDGAGTLFGTTARGGSGNGTVFKLDTAGKLTVLHKFTGADGAEPTAGLVGTKENLYGTTPWGGDSNAGVVFKLIRQSR